MVSNVSLGEVCDFIRGVAFDGNEVVDFPTKGFVPILRAGNIGDELYIHYDLVWVPERRVSSEQYLQVDDIAICMASGSPAVLGKTAQLKEKFAGSVGAFCGIIRPTKADSSYVAYWLKSPKFMAWRDSQANGVNIQNLRPTEIREIEIPLPPLDEQKRIASLLGRADRLRQLRRTGQELGDVLLQSVFLEMFGDLFINQKHWDFVFLEDIADIQGGIQVTSRRGSLELKKPYLRVANVYRNQLDLTEIKVIGLTPDEYKRTKLQMADLLFVEGHGNINEIGRAAVWNGSIEDCVHQNHLIRARLDPKSANPIFVSNFVNSPSGRSYFTNISNTTSGLNTISTNTVKSCPIPLPPLSLQEEFAGVVRRVEGLWGRMGEAERQAEELFQGLLAQSFGAT
jgi:type I restriction enzyme, S subunit